MTPLPLSVLDLSPIGSGSTSTQALQNTLDLARLTDGLGYHLVLAGGAPQYPQYCLVGTGDHHRARRERDLANPGGVGRDDAAESCAAEGGRDVPSAGGAASGPDRSRNWAGAGDRWFPAFALRRSREAMGADDFPEQLQELFAFASGGFPDDCD